MVFKIYTFSVDGVKAEGSYHNHIQAFSVALRLSKHKILTYIIERQWSVKTMSLIDKNYMVKNRSVYNTDDMSIPIYSELQEFYGYDKYRNLVYGIIKNITNIYAYMNVKCPYSDEYLYSYTYNELKLLEASMMSDKIVAEFYTIAKTHLNSVIDTLRNNNLPTDCYVKQLISLEPVEMVKHLQGFRKTIKNHILKTVYGASLIDMYPL